jgi:hypothetical protein
MYSKDNPWELLCLVYRGRKPMAVIVLRAGRVVQVSKLALIKAVCSLGLSCEVMKNGFGVHVAIVFQPQSHLADFYDVKKVIQTYQDVGVELTPQVFETPLTHFATELANECFPHSILYPMIGLCLGYPIQKTLRLIISLGLATPPTSTGPQSPRLPSYFCPLAFARDTARREWVQPCYLPEEDGAGVRLKPEPAIVDSATVPRRTAPERRHPANGYAAPVWAATERGRAPMHADSSRLLSCAQRNDAAGIQILVSRGLSPR